MDVQLLLVHLREKTAMPGTPHPPTPPTGFVGELLVATIFHPSISTVPPTNSPSEGIVGAPLSTASFRLRAMYATNFTNSGYVGAPLDVELFRLCAMHDTNTPCWDLFVYPSWLHRF